MFLHSVHKIKFQFPVTDIQVFKEGELSNTSALSEPKALSTYKVIIL